MSEKFKAETGRLLLEAAAGMHGEVAKTLAFEWSKLTPSLQTTVELTSSAQLLTAAAGVIAQKLVFELAAETERSQRLHDALQKIGEHLKLPIGCDLTTEVLVELRKRGRAAEVGVGRGAAMIRLIKKALYAVFVGEQPQPPGQERVENRRPPIGTSHCSTCNKFIPDGVSCNYDWSGNCTAGDFDFTRDGVVPRSGRAVVQDAEKALKDLNKSLRG